MNLYFDYFPKELVGGLKHKNVKSEVLPVMEIPDFEDNLSSLYSLISEFFLFVTRKSRKIDVYLNDFDYQADIPLNPTYWSKKYPELDLKKYDWFNFWSGDSVKQNRKSLVDLLADNKLITIKQFDKEVYEVLINPYPQFEGLRQIQGSILTLLDEAGVSLYILGKDGEIHSPLPSYFLEKGLIKVGYNVYTLNYTFGSEILLNNRLSIAKLNYGSPNDLFFEYISQHPKKKITREQLENILGVLDRPISKLVYDIGFSGELKKLFFPKVSNNAVYFNNPVTQDDLLTAKIDEELLLEQLKGLKTIHSNTV
jgi:hypothetical protein